MRGRGPIETTALWYRSPQGDSNSHGPNGPQGLQPCARTAPMRAFVGPRPVYSRSTWTAARETSAWWRRTKHWRPRKQLPPSRRATGAEPRLLAVTAERSAYSVRVEGGVRGGCAEAPGLDDDQERRVRLLLLGKGADLAHRFERPLAAELDESEQSAGARRATLLAAPFHVCGRLRPRAAHARKGRAAVAMDDNVRALAIAAQASVSRSSVDLRSCSSSAAVVNRAPPETAASTKSEPPYRRRRTRVMLAWCLKPRPASGAGSGRTAVSDRRPPAAEAGRLVDVEESL